MLKTTNSFSINLVFLSFIIKLTLNDTCKYKEDGTGLLNSYHELYLNGNCYPCMIQCKTCSSVQDIACSSGNCEDNFYFDQSLTQCVKCASLCKTCNGPQESDCHVCLDGLYFNGVSKSCQSCPFGAKTCSGAMAYSCYDRYFLDSQTFACRKCPVNCYSCASQSSCQQCEIGYFFVQSNICKKCEVSNCTKCYNSSTCYQCTNGYDLISGQCTLSNCTQKMCTKCPVNKDNCTICAEGYYLFNNKCYFGSSLLCFNGENGSSYGKCASCRERISYTNDNNPSYCLLSQSRLRQVEYEFKSFSQIVGCDSPEFSSKEGLKMISIDMVVQPLFQIDVEIGMISKLSQSSIKVEFQDINGTMNFKKTNNSKRLSSGFYCLQNNFLQNTQQFKMHRIFESFYVNSLSSNITLKISDITNTSEIYLSEVYIKRILCLVQNCRACFTTGFCSSCKTGYLLEEYQCKKECSEGYFTDAYHQQCVQQCREGYYLVPDEFKCEKCQFECSSCTGINICSKCSSGYFLSNNLCVNTCNQNTTYPEPLTNECKRCKNPCKTCSNIGSNCTSCFQGNLFNGKCIAECPIAYFSSFQSSVVICSLCSSNCKSCSIYSHYCTSCNLNLTLYNGRCLSVCPSGYFQSSQLYSLVNNSSVECKKCQSICAQCQGIQSNCTTCNAGFLLLTSLKDFISVRDAVFNVEIGSISTIFALNSQMKAGICLTKCPEQYFFEDQNNKICVRCPPACIRCESSTNCLKCGAQYFLENGGCLSKCTRITSYMNNQSNKCERCKIPCDICQQDFSGMNCLTCVNGYYQFVSNTQNKSVSYVSCVVRCPIGFYKDNSEIKTCKSCNQNCSECLNLVNCTRCKSGYFLTDKNECTLGLSCSDGYFLDNETNSCKKCHQSCKKCANWSYFCTQCSSANLLIVKDQGTCLNQCPEGYFQKTVYVIAQNSTIVENITQVQNKSYTAWSYCQNCLKDCSACISIAYCMKCTDGYVLLNGKCITACPVSYYEPKYSQEGRICLSCQSNCKRCISPNYCLECQLPSILIQNQCLNSCLDGFYLSSTITPLNLTTYQCNICPNQCQKCTNLNNCTSCNFRYFLQYNQTFKTSLCKTFCSEGFFQNPVSRTCDSCKSPCKTCLNTLVCFSCLNNLTLLNQNCLQTCPDAFYFTQGSPTTPSSCKQCVSPCKKCKSLTQCTECRTGFYLNESSFSCQINCSDGFYANNLTKICEKCQKPCKTCLISADNCKSCIEGFYSRNNFCLSVCPSGTFLDNNGTINSCKNCPETCKACQSANFCTQCKLDYFILQSKSQTNQTNTEQICVMMCPEGYYLSEISRKCNKCHQKCRTCIRDEYTCTSCVSGDVLLRNKCVQKCPSSYHLLLQNSVCEQCGRWCEICNNKNQCKQCLSGYLFQGQCLSECPSGYYEDKENLVCSNCMTGCEICKNQFTCQKCSQIDSFVLLSSHCISIDCPSGYYLFVQQNQCIENCPYLLNKVEQKCHEYKCPSHLIESKDASQCVQKCKDNEFVRYLESEGVAKCEGLSYLEQKSINYEDLPQFKAEVVPSQSEIIVVIRFSFDGIKMKSAQQVLTDMIFSLKISEQSDYSAYRQVSKNLNQTNEQNIEIRKFERRSNAVLAWLKINNMNDQLQAKFENKLILEVYMKNHYLSYFHQVNGQKLPIQNYKSIIQFNLLNYSLQNHNYLGISVTVWILMSLAIIALMAIFLLQKKCTKMYMFASLVQFFQIMYFLSFASVNLPPLMQSLFYSLRFTAGDLVISTMLVDHLPWKESTEIMVSPWQFYKYSGDIHLFKNLSDIIIILGVISIVLIVSKLLNSFTKIGRIFTDKILKNKTKIIEVFLWTFLPLVGLYGIINIRLYEVDKRHQSSLQKSIGYEFFSYLMAIVFFSSCVYFFYYQFMEKTMFDKGINQQKRKLGVSVGLYRYFRKVLFVFFSALYYDNSIYCTCIFLLSTSIIFIIVFWFQPYKNPLRQLLSTIEEGSLIVLFSQILIFILNPDYYAWISFIIVIHGILHILLLLVYPSYWLTMFILKQIDTENIEIDPNAGQIDSVSLENDEKPQKDIMKQEADDKDPQDNSSSTKINFGAIIKKRNQQNVNDQPISANQADESDQGQVIKKKIVNNVIRLAKKQTKKVKMFKNYDFSSQQEEGHSELVQKQELRRKESQKKTKKHQK